MLILVKDDKATGRVALCLNRDMGFDVTQGDCVWHAGVLCSVGCLFPLGSKLKLIGSKGVNNSSECWWDLMKIASVVVKSLWMKLYFDMGLSGIVARHKEITSAAGLSNTEPT